MTQHPTHHRPSVLFVCVKNGGKSQLAAGLLRHQIGDTVEVSSAGTAPGVVLNDLSVQALAELGIDISAERPKAITETMVREADVVVVLGRDARVDPVDGTDVVIWDTDEPSLRGIDGLPRMRLIRDDIATRTQDLADRLSTGPPPAVLIEPTFHSSGAAGLDE